MKYAAEELRECVKFCEKVTGKKMDWDRLAATVELSDKTWDLLLIPMSFARQYQPHGHR